MKLYLPVLAGLLLLGPLAARAQAQPVTPTQQGLAAQANLSDLVNGLPSVLPRGENEGTIGSPYADNRWLPARLDLGNGRPLAPVPVKYDVLGRRLLMRHPKRPADSLELDDQRVRGFVLEEPATPGRPARPRVFRRFAEAPQAIQRTNYVEVLHTGRYTLRTYALSVFSAPAGRYIGSKELTKRPQAPAGRHLFACERMSPRRGSALVEPRFTTNMPPR